HESGGAIAGADVALSSSGTATLECAVLGTPVVVMYKLSRANYLLGRVVVKIPNFSLVNIVAGKKVVPELIQRDVNPQRIAEETGKLLEPSNYARVVEELAPPAIKAAKQHESREEKTRDVLMNTILNRDKPEGQRGWLINRVDAASNNFKSWWNHDQADKWRKVLGALLIVFLLRAFTS